MRLTGLALALALGAACQISPKFAGLDQEVRPISYDETLALETLANGMRVAIVPDRRTNLVTVDVRYEVGAADDPPGRAGMAHFAEHVMWELGVRGGAGATSLGDATLFSNASTTHSSTQFTSIALDSELDRVLEIEARRLEVPCITLRDEMLTRERDVVIEELKLRTASTPAMDGLAAAVWGAGHPYGRSAGGSEFARAPMTELCAFVSGHYVPRAATMVITGNVTPTMLDRVRTRFEQIPDRAPPLRTVLPRLPAPSGQPIVVEGLARPTTLLVIPVPPAGTDADGLVEIATHQIRERLRDGGAWAADAFVLGDHRARVLVAHVEADTPADLDRAVTDMQDALDSSVSYDITDLQRDARTEIALGFDRLWDRGARLAEQAATTSHPSRYRRLQLIERLSNEAVHRFIRRSRGRIVKLVPATAITGAGRIASLTTQLHRLDVARSPVEATAATSPVALPTTRVPRRIEDYALANGLRVVLAPDPYTIAIDTRLVLPVGSATDPITQPGRAAIAAQALDPADGWSEGEYESRLVRWYLTTVGRRPAVGVSAHATTFRTTGLAVFADWHVWNVAWTVMHGTYAPSIDKLAKYARPARARARTKRPPNLYALLGRILDPDRSDRPTSSWVTRAELARFRRAAYRPAGATLIVSGNFDVTAMRREIELLFGPWREPEVALPPATVVRDRAISTPRYVAIEDPGAIATHLLIAYVARDARPDARPDDHLTRAARDTLSAMLDDRMRVVREGMGVSYGIHGAVGARTILISGSVHNAHAAHAMAVIDTEIDHLRSAGDALAADFARARRLVLGRQLADPSGASERAEELERNASRGAALDDTDRLVGAIRTLTLAGVTRAAAELSPDRRIVILRGPRASLQAGFEALAVDPARIEWAPRE